MGNRIGKCFAGDSGEISRRRNHAAALYSPDPLDEGLGHSFVYIPPELLPKPQPKTAPFRTISGAAISANTSTPLSTDPFPYRDSNSLDKSSTFESSNFFSSIPLQPIPRNSVHTVKSGPILRNSVSGSGPIEHGFMSGPIERSFISGPLDNQFDCRAKPKKRAVIRNIRNMISKSFWNLSKELSKDQSTSTNSGNSSTINSRNLSSELSLGDENENDDVENESFRGQNLQWAQGKAGEDRVHIVISEDHGWVFVGIYDGFNGPDATDFLSSNLYGNVHKELKGLLDGDDESSVDHFRVLRGLSEGLRKTEASYLEIADMMLVENPELALMGSCVVCMVMKGDDVYVMNVGDSRAVLARKVDHGKTTKDYAHFLNSYQLTVDHTTSLKGEVRRIRNAHLDDPFAVMNDRVKGSLKVTRAFGAGFLKQPKWNNALLEMFRIDYIGTSPYITCSPSLHHHRVGPKDKFLILSSDGLYQYFTNEEAVSEVEMFMAMFPEGDPAQHLVEQVLVRAAKKAGMDFYDLLDIPQGDRRRYHDDVSIIIVSFEGSTWRSSV